MRQEKNGDVSVVATTSLLHVACRLLQKKHAGESVSLLRVRLSSPGHFYFSPALKLRRKIEASRTDYGFAGRDFRLKMTCCITASWSCGEISRKRTPTSMDRWRAVLPITSYGSHQMTSAVQLTGGFRPPSFISTCKPSPGASSPSEKKTTTPPPMPLVTACCACVAGNSVYVTSSRVSNRTKCRRSSMGPPQFRPVRRG